MAVISGNQKKPRNRINRAIIAHTVMLVDPDKLLGDHETGLMPRDDALAKAVALKKDLVEVNAKDDVPVVRIMDYNKFLFDSKKTKKRQKLQKLKEIKMRPVTEEADYKVKLRNLVNFLKEGDKVKVTIRYRGREITHQELGADLAKRVIDDLQEFGVVDQMPKLEGKQLVMLFSPKR